MNFFHMTFTLFLLMDSAGNIPLYISILKGIPAEKQKKIIVREMLFALLTIALFAFLGEPLLKFLNISQPSIFMGGAIILFLMSLKMIFPPEVRHHAVTPSEPFLVPLAIPLIAGPAVLATVMLYSQYESLMAVLSASAMAWLCSLSILLSAPFLSKKMGKKGLSALERLMGLILVLLSVEMFFHGLATFFRLPC